jgi:hypothetical protein
MNALPKNLTVLLEALRNGQSHLSRIVMLILVGQFCLIAFASLLLIGIESHLALGISTPSTRLPKWCRETLYCQQSDSVGGKEKRGVEDVGH